MGTNDTNGTNGAHGTLLEVIDGTERALGDAALSSATIGRSMGRLVRAEALDEDARPHRGTLLRLAFLAHVWAPSLETGMLVTSMMRAQLLEAGAMEPHEVFEDLRLVVASCGGDAAIQRKLIVDSLERGFIGDRAGVALRAPELLACNEDVLAQMLATGVPRPR